MSRVAVSSWSRRAVIAIVACAFGLPGCGGSSPPSRTPADVQVLHGTPSATVSAGAVPDYRVTGRLVADSGLRPPRDGFAFENYGDADAVTNLTPAAVEELFGGEVCASGTRATCRLIPPARAWMEEENDAMAAGHCFGMAVAAAQFYARQLPVTTFGAPSAARLALAGNAPLQRTIAQLNALQELPSIRRTASSGTPNEILDKLIASMRAGGKPLVLGLFHPSGSGHAVTPYAVEDRGDGRFAVLVYDNNFPGVTRAISFDRHANAWKFIAQANPKATGQLYAGDAHTSNLAVFPTEQPTGLLPCPFCTTTAGTKASDARRATEISLEGDPENHAHLLITDARGRRTGRVGRRIVNAIPGAQVVERLNNRDWAEDSEPVYSVPYGVPVTVRVDGRTLTAPVVERLEIIGPGDRVEVSGIALRRGEAIETGIAGDGSRVSLTTDRRHDETPVLRLGIEAKPASWDFTLKATRLRGGSTLRFLIDRPRRQIDIDTRGVHGASRYDMRFGEYDMRFDRYAIGLDRLGRHGTATFRRSGLQIPPGSVARLRYGAFDDRHRTLDYSVTHAGTTSRERLSG